jgi:hypothetical protein
MHQTLDRLEKGVDLLLIGSDGTIALVHRCYFEVHFKVATDVLRQGHVGITPEVEPPLVPPLIG